MIDLLPSTYLSQEESLAQKQLYLSKKRALSSAIATLTEREANILTARKLNETPSTLDSLSNEYNISKERVRQIENKAFEKVKFYILEKLTPDGQLKALLN